MEVTIMSGSSTKANLYISRTLACGHLAMSICLTPIFADDSTPELPPILSIIGFSKHEIRLPIVSIYWITLSTQLKDEYESDVFYMLLQASYIDKFTGIIPLGDDWYGMISPKPNGYVKGEAPYFHLSIFPQGSEHHLLIDPRNLRGVHPKSYASDQKIPLPKPDIVETTLNKIRKYGQNLPNDEVKFKTCIDQCRKMVEIFHHTPLKDELIRVLHTLREKNPIGSASQILIETLKDFGDHQSDPEMEDLDEVMDEYEDEAEEEAQEIEKYNDDGDDDVVEIKYERPSGMSLNDLLN